MEVISTTIYSKHDIFGCWSVKWENRGGGDGLSKIAAVIIPYWDVLFQRLDTDGYISYFTCKQIIDSLSNTFSSYYNPYVYSQDRNKAIEFLNAFSDFCESEKIVIEKIVYSFWDAFSIGGGNVGAFEKAQKKIKKELVLDGEDTVYKRLIRFLRNRHLIN